jgi:hypothetical protein
MDGVFIESSIFSRLLPGYLDDEDYRQLQISLLDAPESGDLIQGSGGLRKLRYGLKQQDTGKQGGLRIIYCWHKPVKKYFMITLYAKSELGDLTKNEIRSLRSMVIDWTRE